MELNRFSWEENPKSMEYGMWYPFPCGAMWINNTKYYFDGWDIFERANDDGDIKPIERNIPRTTLENAVRFCEEHNGKTFDEIPR